jgi:hypothetical protein
VILGLAGQGLNQTVESRRQIEAARATIQKKFSGELEAGNRTEGYWSDWGFAQVLLAEAAATGL